MQHDAIEPPGEKVGPLRDPDRGVEDTIGLALRRAQLRRVGLEPPGARGNPRSPITSSMRARRSFVPPAGPRPTPRRGSQLDGEPVEIDLDLAMAGYVEHVEREDHRPADTLQLEREAQREPEVGRVRDTDEEAEFPRLRAAPTRCLG